MGKVKRLSILVFSIMVMLTLSMSVFGAEINLEEKRILSNLEKEPFASNLDSKYVNQFENYFSTDDVTIEKANANAFLDYFSKALMAYKKSKANGKVFGQSSESFELFQKAGSAIGLYLEYDSNTNEYYAIDKDGYVVIDRQKVIKDTDVAKTNTKTENKTWGVSIEIIFAGVILLCFVGFLLNIKRWVKKIRKHNDKNYDDEEDEMEVANRKTRRARLQTFSYRNFKQVLKYFYIPLIMCIIIVGVLVIVGRPYSSLYTSITEGFINNLTINSYSEEVPKYDDAPQIDDKTISGAKVKWPRSTEPYGEIKCKKINLNAPLFMGDSDYVLSGEVRDKVENDIEDQFVSSMKDVFKGGAGTYLGSSIPGGGKTILVGAHDTTYFKPLEKVTKGMVMDVNTSYARYKYKVKDIRIYDTYEINDAYDLSADREQLILYTCYPFGKLDGDKSKRWFVYLDKIYGPSINREVTK